MLTLVPDRGARHRRCVSWASLVECRRGLFTIVLAAATLRGLATSGAWPLAAGLCLPRWGLSCCSGRFLDGIPIQALQLAIGV